MDRDITLKFIELKARTGKVQLTAHEDFVFYGQALLDVYLKQYSPASKVKWMFADGSLVLKGQSIAILEGNTRDIYCSQNNILSFIAKLSGALTLLKCYTEQAKGTDLKVISSHYLMDDLHELQEDIFKLAGVDNSVTELKHKVVLDSFLIHNFEGNTEAVNILKETYQGPISLKVKNQKELKEFDSIKADHYIFQTNSLELIRSMAQLIPPESTLEVRGSFNAAQILPLAQAGVHYFDISTVLQTAPLAQLGYVF